MDLRLALVAIVVRDYDEAIAWYTGVLGFLLVETRTWAAASAGWWSLRRDAAGAPSCWRGRPRRTRRPISATRRRPRLPVPAHGRFREGPRRVPIARRRIHERAARRDLRKVAVFADLYGNRWTWCSRAPWPTQGRFFVPPCAVRRRRAFRSREGPDLAASATARHEIFPASCGRPAGTVG